MLVDVLTRTCMCIYAYTHSHVYAGTYVREFVSTWMSVYMRMRTCLRVRVLMCASDCVLGSSLPFKVHDNWCVWWRAERTTRCAKCHRRTRPRRRRACVTVAAWLRTKETTRKYRIGQSISQSHTHICEVS